MPDDNNFQQNPKDQQLSDEQAGQQLYVFVLQSMKDGKTKEQMVQELVTGGAEQKNATEAVEKAYKEFLQLAREQQFLPSDILPSIVGGLLAALMGGFLWGLIVKLTNYEIGFAAIGIGMLCGHTILFFNSGKKDFLVQLIASGSSFLGVFVGKFWTYYHYYQQMLVEEFGAKLAAEITPFSMDVLLGFPDYLIESFKGGGIIYDSLWLFLALGSAWKLTRGLNLPHLPEQDLVADAPIDTLSYKRNGALTLVGLLVLVLLFNQLSASVTFTPKTMAEMQASDVELIFNLLQKSETTYHFFEIVTPEDVAKTKEELNQFLAQGKSKEELLTRSEELLGEFEEAAIKLSETEAPKDFTTEPDLYPDFQSLLYTFYLTDFRVVVFEGFYTFHFDRNYTSVLRSDAQEAVEKIGQMMQQLEESAPDSN